MFKSYMKVAFRSMFRNKRFTSINIFGLAVGMACSLLIFLFVKDEQSYDRFHQDSNRIYRVVKDFINDDRSRIPDATTPAALAPALMKLPEIEKITRIFPNWGATWLIKYGDKKIVEEKLWRVDSSFFDVFTIVFIQGNKVTALKDSRSIVLTESAARRYFDKQDPLGKTISLKPGEDMLVSAVIKDIPANSHFHFDFLVSIRQLSPTLDNDWEGYNYYTYIKLKAGSSVAAVTKKIQTVYESSQEKRYSDFYVQPLTDIHLNSHLKWELEPNGDQLYVYIFTIVGIFILLIAAINYINLSTAKSTMRAKEIGVRKVSGALKASLIKQFLFESVITCLLASLLAIVIAQLLVPPINNLTQKQLTVIGDPILFLYILLAALLVGVLAGLFPALYLSSFRPISVLKGFKMDQRGALGLRKTLVVLQFTISIALIIGAIIMVRQIDFMRSAKLGFDKEQVVIVKNASSLSRAERTTYLNSIRQLPGVMKAADANLVLGQEFATTRLRPRGSDREQQLNFATVGLEYFDVMGIQMKEGRGFSPQFPGDTIRNAVGGGPLNQTIGGIVINEQTVKDFGLKSPVVGQELLWNSNGDTSYYVKIIGVARDFHFTSLRNAIKPFGFLCYPGFQSSFSVKLAANNINGTLAQLADRWRQFAFERPFEYFFLDDSFATLYSSEARFQKIFIGLVVLGIFIACLGLLGLATYAAQQRTKEIGIRKTLGASVTNVVLLLSGDFVKLVVVALFIAIPMAWYVMDRWLQDFAYRIDIEWWIFMLASIIAIGIAFLTISFQTIQAARANPVNSLRTE